MPVPNEVFSGISFAGFFLCVIPLYWHMEAWNIGTCLFILWAGFGSLNFFINSIIWNHNVINWAPVWCDISTKFMIGVSVAIPATSMCINRRLYKISSVRAVLVTRKEKRREMCIDFAIGLGFPIVVMALHYIVQGHRFNIYEDIGCLPYTWNTHLSYFLVWMWPLVTGVFSAGYCSMTIWNFYKRGRQMREVMSTHSNLNTARYARLMLLAALELSATIPLGIYVVVSNATQLGPVLPWKSWSDTHFDFSKVNQYPRVLWGGDARLNADLELQRWLTVACAFEFIAIFGFADEARKHYRLAYTSVASRLGVSTTSSTATDSGFGSSTARGGVSIRVSTYGPEMSRVKRDSLASDQLSTSISLGGYYNSDDESAFRANEKEKEEFSPVESTLSSASSTDIRGLPTLLSEHPSMLEPAVLRPDAEIAVEERHPIDPTPPFTGPHAV